VEGINKGSKLPSQISARYRRKRPTRLWLRRGFRRARMLISSSPCIPHPIHFRERCASQLLTGRPMPIATRHMQRQNDAGQADIAGTDSCSPSGMWRFDDLDDLRRDKHSVALLARGLFEDPLADQFFNVQLGRAMGDL
jgi:hypothetical protein